MYTQDKMVWEFVLSRTINFEYMPIKKMVIFFQTTFVSVHLRLWLWIWMGGLFIFLGCHRKSAEVLQEPVRLGTDTIFLSQDTIAAPIVQQDTIALVPKDTIEEVYVLVKLEKTACYGRCPAYEARLLSDGRLIWLGKAHVPLIGQFEALADSTFLPQILEFAERINYFGLADYYPKDGHLLSDLPTTITYLGIDNELIKMIRNNYQSPKALREFEAFLEELFIGQDWQKIQSAQ